MQKPQADLSFCAAAIWPETVLLLKELVIEVLKQACTEYVGICFGCDAL